MKILLAYTSGATKQQDLYLNLLPTGLLYIQSYLSEAGYEVQLANFSGWSEERTARSIATFAPSIVGISQWTHNRHASLQLARSIKRKHPECMVVLGGGHATFSYHSILTHEPSVDVVVIGEGEITLHELADCIAGKNAWQHISGIAFRKDDAIITNPPQKAIQDLDLLPFPAKYIQHSTGVDIQLQAEFVLTARGCPSTCRFCSSPAFWPQRLRFRSPEKIVEEILYLRDRFGLIYFSFRDDTFTADRKRTLEFCRLLIERKAFIIWNCQSRVTALDEETVRQMKLAGCECIQLGVESGSPRILKYLGKNIQPGDVEQAAALIREAGINLSIYLISDIPGEREEDLRQTIELIGRIKPDDGYVSPLAWYPGTRLFQDAVATGEVSDDIFDTSREPAIFAVKTAGKNSARMLKSLTSVANHNTLRTRGAEYCYVTNVLVGEQLRLSGKSAAAEEFLLEITLKEPDNPWGWYLLGDLSVETGKAGQAAKQYENVLKLVPRHLPSLAALQELQKKRDLKIRPRSGKSS